MADNVNHQNSVLHTAKTWSGQEITGVLLVFRDRKGDKPDCIIIPVDDTGTPEFNEDGYVEINVDPSTVRSPIVDELERLRKERDAAVADLEAGFNCFACRKLKRNGGRCLGGKKYLPLECPGFEWRGLSDGEGK